jgi:hypothetical protein
MHQSSPLGAFFGGLAAGFVGSLAQNLFFAATKKLAPTPAFDSFDPVEPQQAREMPTETVARRVVEGIAQRGPLVRKSSAGQLVHLAYGSAWGSLYGLVGATLPRVVTLKGGLGFGLAVWLLSDDILLPAFRLGAWPHHYPVKTHLYAIGAHAVYGAAVAVSFAALQGAARPATAALGSAWLTRRWPRLVRPTARRVLTRSLRIALPVRAALAALE